jgi:two-component system, chemotaxis family, protein-glutamate methylesterase/glutaminase
VLKFERLDGVAAIKVLVVDDSITMRALFSSTLDRSNNLVVVGAAANADEAREMIADLNPDVVTLDIEMPGMSGIEFLEEIMTTKPIPVIMLSTLTQKGAESTLRALEIGAIDCFPKPTKATPDEFAKLSDKLCKLVATASRSKLRVYVPGQIAAQANLAQSGNADAYYNWNGNVVVISASTGGSVAVTEMLASWPSDCPPTIVLQQFEEGLGAPFAARLNKAIRPIAVLAEDGMPLKQGHVYLLSEPDRHGLIDRWPNGAIRLIARDPVNGCRPSADLLFSALAKVGGAQSVGVILSGIGEDGVAGLAAIRRSGGLALCQNRDGAMFSEAVEAAMACGAAEQQLPLADLAQSALARCALHV